jgi:octaprenyl-diphosphate synthase
MIDFAMQKTLITHELKKFNKIFLTSFSAEEQLLDNALKYLMPQKGKQIRPILAILAAKICGNITPNTYYIGSAYELLHLASLIHDDVVDNSLERRNQPSLNKQFNNKTAVLVGDYLMTKAIKFALQTQNIEMISILQNFGSMVVRGELLQQQHSKQFLSIEDYYTIIRYKTAALFAICAKAGAISADANAQQISTLHNFGENLGMCFQIKDDIFDYTPDQSVGKPPFNDITEGKLTLPLILSLLYASENEKNKVLKIINNDNIIQDDKLFILDLINRYGGIRAAEDNIIYFKQKAIEAIEIFEDSPYKDLLMELLNYSVERKI